MYMMQEELEASLPSHARIGVSFFAAKLEAAQEVAAATAKALTEQIEELKAAARAAEERHAKEREEDAKARLERAAAVEEVARRLAAEHEETRLASALARRAEVTGTPRSVMAPRRDLSDWSRVASEKASPKQAEAEAAAKLAQVH